MRPEIERLLLEFQRNEMTEYRVYLSLAARSEGENRRVLERIAEEELRHYSILRRHTGNDVKPSAWRVLLYSLSSKVFGVTFAIKLMERSEELAQEGCRRIVEEVPEAATILKEERVEYVGFMVLGLNDALVELTGALAGLTFALQDPRLIGVAGLVMGTAASLSTSKAWATVRGRTGSSREAPSSRDRLGDRTWLKHSQGPT